MGCVRRMVVYRTLNKLETCIQECMKGQSKRPNTHSTRVIEMSRNLSEEQLTNRLAEWESLFIRKENEGLTSLPDFIQIRIHIVRWLLFRQPVIDLLFNLL